MNEQKSILLLAVLPTIVAVLSMLLVIAPSAKADPGNGDLTDKCLSDSTTGNLKCGAGDQGGVHSDSKSGEAKKECRENGDKCSSSQTGNGEFGNRFKKNCFGPNADPC